MGINHALDADCVASVCGLEKDLLAWSFLHHQRLLIRDIEH